MDTRRKAEERPSSVVLRRSNMQFRNTKETFEANVEAAYREVQSFDLLRPDVVEQWHGKMNIEQIVRVEMPDELLMLLHVQFDR